MGLVATGRKVARPATEYELSRVLAGSARTVPPPDLCVKAGLGVSWLDDDPTAAAFHQIARAWDS